MSSRGVRPIGPALLAACLAGCSGHEYYTRAQLDAIEVGMSAAELLGVMGEPSARDQEGPMREVWTYEGEIAEGMYGQPVAPYRVHVTLMEGRVVDRTVEDAGGNTR